MKIRPLRPWLDGNGIEFSAKRLREISKAWNPQTWEEYLKWYESGRREMKVSRKFYDDRLEQQTQTIFELNDISCPDGAREFCEQMLKTLPGSEERVLRRLFFDGMTIRRVSEIEGFSKSRIHRLKNTALSRLRDRYQGGSWDTQRYMRGSLSKQSDQTLWDRLATMPFGKGSYTNTPIPSAQEFSTIDSKILQAGLDKLSRRQREAIYLHFWCDLPVEQVARKLRVGINVAGMILAVSVKRLKQSIATNAAKHETTGE